MNLLRRLIEAPVGDPDEEQAVPRFYAERAFAWQLELDLDGVPKSDRLVSLVDPDDEHRRRGQVRRAPSLKRSSGIRPLLGADDIQYVLGWSDDKAKPDRVAKCLNAFITAVEDWLAGAPDDPQAKAVARFYRDGRHRGIQHPEQPWTSKDGVLIVVNGRAVVDSSGLQQAWARQALTHKAGTGGAQALCLVCGELGSPLLRLPHGLPKQLVPGASQEVAVLSVNLPIFGHTFSNGLGASPICDRCGEGFVNALRTMAGHRQGREAVAANRSYGTMHYRGQRSRLVWWVLGRQEFQLEALLGSANANAVKDLFDRVGSGVAVTGTNTAGEDRFCALMLGGSAARLAVHAWIDRPLPKIEANLRQWFDDHEIRPVDPYGNPYVGLSRMVRAAGRWQQKSGERPGYAKPKQGSDPWRPPELQQCLLDAALLGRQIPFSVLAHLVNRIRADRHVDQSRAALLRLYFRRHRSPSTPEVTVPHPGPGLDESYHHPAYLAGRVMAVLGSIQYTSVRARGLVNTGINTTFEDRYLSGAIANPAVAIVQGRQQASAWLKKLKRDRPAAEARLRRLLDELLERFDAETGLPGRLTVEDQGRFILGYHHQRSHDIRAAMEFKQAGRTDVPEVPDADLTDDDDDQGAQQTAS